MQVPFEPAETVSPKHAPNANYARDCKNRPGQSLRFRHLLAPADAQERAARRHLLPARAVEDSRALSGRGAYDRGTVVLSYFGPPWEARLHGVLPHVYHSEKQAAALREAGASVPHGHASLALKGDGFTWKARA